MYRWFFNVVEKMKKQQKKEDRAKINNEKWRLSSQKEIKFAKQRKSKNKKKFRVRAIGFFLHFFLSLSLEIFYRPSNSKWIKRKIRQTWDQVRVECEEIESEKDTHTHTRMHRMRAKARVLIEDDFFCTRLNSVKTSPIICVNFWRVNFSIMQIP